MRRCTKRRLSMSADSNVSPERITNNRDEYRETLVAFTLSRDPTCVPHWNRCVRYIAHSMLAKHRVFVLDRSSTLPASIRLLVFARDDDYFFGVLHSRVHELWARATGTQLREAESGFRYTPTTTFETFPFPWPPGQEPAGDARVEAIAEAARALVALRDAWLNAGKGEAFQDRSAAPEGRTIA